MPIRIGAVLLISTAKGLDDGAMVNGFSVPGFDARVGFLVIPSCDAAVVRHSQLRLSPYPHSTNKDSG
jgi:hypothetical protein